MDIATLGLSIVNDAAVRALDFTSSKLDAMGASADKASAKVTAAGTAARAAGTEYERLSSQQIADAAAKFDAMYGSATKAAAATKTAAVAAEVTSTQSALASAGLGRLRQSFSSLAAEATGTSPIIDRILSTLSGFAVGNVEVIAILAGVSAIGAAWHAMAGGMSADAKYAEDAIKRLRDEVQKTKDAMGTVTLAAAKANLDAAQGKLDEAKQKAAGRDQTPGSFGAMVSQSDIEAAQKAVNDAQAVYTQAVNDQKRARADGLADLIRSNQLTAQERKNALAQLKADQAEAHALLGKTDDVSMDRRIALSREIGSLTDALYPKKDARAAHELAQKRFEALMQQADATRASVLHMLPHGQKPGEMDVFGAFGRTNPLTERSLTQGAMASLRSGARNGPAADLFNAMDRVSILQAQLDATNASRELRGQKAEKPGKDLLDAKKAAADYGAAAIDAIAHSNQSWAVQRDLIAEIVKLLHQAGVESKDVQPSRAQQIAGNVSSGMRTAADAINLFGTSPRAQQYANILNTASNADDNITAAAEKGFADPIKDAQAIISVASLGKQIFGLGKQSHDAARAVAEASEAVKNMLDQLRASVAHDALGSLLANAQAADDARRKQINDDLSGKKKERERNQRLAEDAQLYGQQVQQIKDQYAKQQVLDADSLNARLLRAKGLTYQADMADLAVKQQQEYNQAVIDGRDATYLATLAQVQLAEKTALANQEITQLANSPTGFFAERYFGQFATPVTALPPSIATAQAGAAGSNNNNTTTINVSVPGAGDPITVAQNVVKTIRHYAMATVGVGGSLADAMEVMG